MNKERRKKIDKIIEAAERTQELLEALKEAVEEVLDEERECLDNIPENLQSTEGYEKAETAVGELESALEWFDGADVDDLLSALSNAAE